MRIEWWMIGLGTESLGKVRHHLNVDITSCRYSFNSLGNADNSLCIGKPLEAAGNFSGRKYDPIFSSFQ